MNYSDKFGKMREAGIFTTNCLDQLKDIIRPGITTKDIENAVISYQERHPIINAQHGYKGFPGFCCTSVNETMCHEVPSDKVLNEGDIVSVDVTFKKEGWHADACRTYFVGDVSDKKKNLVEIAERATHVGVEAAQPGNQIGDIGRAIEKFAKSSGSYEIIRDFVGHSIGLEFHGGPNISHVRETDTTSKMILTPGMTFTIEPIVVVDNSKYMVLEDRWTIVSRTKKPSAQFEVTLGITETGNEIFCH